MDFLDIIAAAIIGVVVFVCCYLYYQYFLIDILIKWNRWPECLRMGGRIEWNTQKGVQTTAVVVDSTAATRFASLQHSDRHAHYITYEFTDTAGKKWTNTKRVRTHHRLAGVVKGTKIHVYYLPDRPDKSALG